MCKYQISRLTLCLLSSYFILNTASAQSEGAKSNKEWNSYPVGEVRFKSHNPETEGAEGYVASRGPVHRGWRRPRNPATAMDLAANPVALGGRRSS